MIQRRETIRPFFGGVSTKVKSSILGGGGVTETVYDAMIKYDIYKNILLYLLHIYWVLIP